MHSSLGFFLRTDAILDGNGALDPEESVYATREDLIRAIAANVYPSPPARDLYFVLKGKPGNALLQAFVLWVLGDGQKYVSEMGYLPAGPDRVAAGRTAVSGATTEKR